MRPHSLGLGFGVLLQFGHDSENGRALTVIYREIETFSHLRRYARNQKPLK